MGSEEIAKRFTDEPVYVAGVSQGSGYNLHAKQYLTTHEATRAAAKACVRKLDFFCGHLGSKKELEFMQLTGLEGKNALVTGASRGIGKAIAGVLAKSGAQVVCCAKNEEVLAQVCSEIKKDGGLAIPVKADIAIASDRQRLMEQIIAKVKGIDILVNNAGIHINTPALELEDPEFLRVMQVNFLSMFSLARDVAKQMITRGGGRIINMGSVSGQGGGSKQVAYCASKAAIEAMTRSLAIEWAKYNINVNTVAPGIIRTDMSRPGWENEAYLAKVQSQIPAHRMGEPEDVAHLVAFLCSKESRYLTGHIYYVDGGVMISR